MKCINKFKIGDKVILNGNPFDEQLGEFGIPHSMIVTDIKDVSNIEGTSGQWIKTNFYSTDYIDAAWFDKIEFGVDRNTNIKYIKHFNLNDVDDNTLNKIGNLLANSKTSYDASYTNKEKEE